MSVVGRVSDSELVRALLHGAPVRVAAFDRSGRLLLDPDPNPPLPSDQGAPPGANFFELYADAFGLRDAIARAFSGEVARVTRLIGGAVYMGTFFPRRERSGEIESVIGVATLLQEGQGAQQALAELQARERGIFQSSMMGLLYFNERGAIAEANDCFLQMLGYTREDLTHPGLLWHALPPKDHRASAEAALAEIHSRGRCEAFETEYLRKDGQRLSVLIGGSGFQFGGAAGVAFVVDISERKLDMQERRAAESTLRRVVDAAPLILWSVDTAGLCTLMTGRGLQTLGLAPGQMLGQSVFDLYRDMPEITESIRRALRGEECTGQVELQGAYFENIFSPMRDATGAVTGVLGISIDVSERRRAELEQERLRAQLLQVQKLESLGLLAGGIAHDFNNILTAILGGASTAMLTIPHENPARQDLEHVMAAAQRAATLTRQMLAYSGKGHVEIRPISLSSHVREIATLLETTIPKKVQLRLELQRDLPSIEADVAQVQQVIMNLVINAAEAIGDQRGTVLVTTGTQLVDELYAESLFAAEGLVSGWYVFLEVHDSGHGMDEATKSKIFDPFFTTKFTGRGLGLAAVLGIVRGHRGAIKVYSSPGRGTTFKVFFPSSDAPAVADDRSSDREFQGQGRVLVIDDDPGVRSAMRRMLEYFGFTVLEAPDGEAGVRTFGERASEIVLVIVDMTMPKMNGEETFRAIRRTGHEVPVLLTSGYNEIEATRRFTSKGLAGFLEKPFTPADLANKLAKILSSR